jgi:hypothetical protein
MPFPDAGESIPSTEVGNIKFSDLRLSYLSNGSSGGNEGLNDEEGVLNLSFFRGVAFTSGDPVPGEGAISIGTDFCGKTFAPEEGGGEETFTIQITRDEEGEYLDGIGIEFGGIAIEDKLEHGSDITHTYVGDPESPVSIIFSHVASELIFIEESLSNCELLEISTSEPNEEGISITTASVGLIDPSTVVKMSIILT